MANFGNEVFKVLKDLDYIFNLILIDDGSSDKGLEVIKRLKPSKNCQLSIIELSRNFGKEIAIAAGFSISTGDAAIIIDTDLQHPPEMIPAFLKKWQEGYECVVGIRKNEVHENKLRLYGANIFYKIINKISSTEIIPNATDYRLVDKQIVTQYNRFTEKNRISRGLIDWLGYKRATIEFSANQRLNGEPSYSTSKLFNLAITSFISHSTLPLKMIGQIGSLITLLSGLFGLFIIIEQFIFKDPWDLNFSGPAMLSILLIFVCGIIVMTLGLFALYLSAIYTEVLNRPLFVIKNHHSLQEKSKR